jgi:hypothetical protein
MWTLIKKFSPMFILYLGMYALIFFPLLNYSRFTQDENPAELIYLLYQGAWGFWVILGAIWVHEQIETKSSSYSFLRILPIRNQEIVGAKFAVVLISVLFFVVYQTGVVALLVRDAEYSRTAWLYNLSVGNLCLLLAGLFYIGIYRFGFLKFGKVMLGSWLLLFLSPLLVREVAMRRFQLDEETLITQITSYNGWLVTAAVLLIYWGMLNLSVRLKNAQQG